MKRVAIVLVFLSLGYLVSAQGITVGAKFGPSFVNFTGSDISNNKMKPSFFGGVFGNYGVTDMISAQAELNIEGKGTKIKVGNNSAKQSLTYLTIPLLAKATFDAGPVKVYGNLGPYFSFLMRAAVDGDTKYDDVEIIYNQFGMPIGTKTVKGKYKDDLKGFDFGLSWGGGAMYEIMEGLSALVDLRLNHGFSKIPDASNNNNVKNFSFQVGFGVAYTLGN